MVIAIDKAHSRFVYTIIVVHCICSTKIYSIFLLTHMLLVWMFVVRRACCCWWRCCCLSLCATCDCDVRLTLLWAWTLTSHNTENGERGQVRMARGERQVNIACPSLRYLSPCSYNSNNSILYINNHRWTRCICCYIFFFCFLLSPWAGLLLF